MARQFKNYQQGKKSIFDIINKISFVTPISNIIFYAFFIVFSLIVIIMLIWKNDASNISWYISYTHFFIRLFILTL